MAMLEVMLGAEMLVAMLEVRLVARLVVPLYEAEGLSFSFEFPV